ncbi:ATP-binding protein [Candidatus Woesearchaeota archaeon]|nr:ATP-binding protein [Candidatus Woesearchaeota archaeon]
MDKSKLRELILDQQQLFSNKLDLVDRDISLEYALKGNEIIIISGIRRSGKSSLLKLISEKTKGIKLFLNFDDVRFVDFSTENFHHIEEIAIELYGTNTIIYFLDEVQNILYWEKWVNNLYSQGNKVFVTGSNSDLLSSEIATHLTGRNKVIQLLPFSFKEYLRLKQFGKIDVDKFGTLEKTKVFSLFLDYFEKGGFPLIIKNDDVELSRQYFEDILNKDVLQRYKIKEIKELKDLIVFLLSNIGRIYSYSTLKKVTGIKSLSTVKNYIDYLHDVFILYKIDRFDYSLAKQKVSSSKIYTIDNSFLKTVAFNFSENKGRRLENLIFVHLLRKNKEIYYHLEKKECDFVTKHGLNINAAIQVAFALDNSAVKEREIVGLLDCMRKYQLNEGMILTMENEEIIHHKSKTIIVKPVWKWLLEE